MVEIAIVSMPFQPLHTPPLGPALLKAELAEAGIACDDHYLGLLLASMVGCDSYNRVVAQPQSYLAGEWVFSAALFPGHTDLDETYLSTVIVGDPDSLDPQAAEAEALRVRADLVALRQQVEPYLERCLTVIDWSRYRMVGFSSSHQQHVPSLVLAKRLKERFPAMVIAFGGANCDAEMGAATFRLFHWIDALCHGEGDEVFPRLAAQVLSGGALEPLPGLWQRGMPEPQALTAVENLDALPFPDFDSYFAQFDGYGLTLDYLDLPFQATRGCWWGMKSHCVFCSQTKQSINMRLKSPSRVVDEMLDLL